LSAYAKGTYDYENLSSDLTFEDVKQKIMEEAAEFKKKPVGWLTNEAQIF
jgi:hypothetical protein